MHLDIRIPIGLLFFAIGLLLVLEGALSPPSLYDHSPGFNINLWWGGVLVAFGGVMLFLSRRSLREFRKSRHGGR